MIKGRRRPGRYGDSYRLEDIWADPEEIGGTIMKMEKNYPGLKSRVFILTEGPGDYEFYSRFFNGEISEIRFANSKDNVIKILDDLSATLKEGTGSSVIGIVDRDFSFFIPDGTEGRENLFMTDTHDIETMIISDELIGKVLEYYKKRSAGGEFQRSMIDSLRKESILSSLVRCSVLIGLSLYVNQKYSLNMTFKHINCKKKNLFMEFTDPVTLICDEDKLLALISGRNVEKSEVFREALSEEKDKNPDYFNHPMQLCRGHDLMCALLADINVNYPQMDGKKVLLRDLERLFRNLYDRNDFFSTELFRSLEQWAKNNLPEISDSLLRCGDSKTKIHWQ
ncbi:DUF4435 domain-containing protein [Methanoplanus endosymbiosus]|uniref:DUF4435 domain-containing protein n=1 Tax=Methanoplanus endosymbiosus TaxID=33865 RepID=A0A9E7PQS8_9EURY|nr:DUF4435 domain-containing protein [Methanoplanus endosymbiosus]UUX93249.1 DUF4435 domain-containing protein [Methanoplanus endosymbiosus]